MRKPISLKYLILSGLFVLAGTNLLKTTREIINSSKRLESLNQEVGQLEDKAEDLKADIEYKKTEEYIEEKARNDLNLVKPNEKLFVVKGQSVEKTEVLAAKTETAIDNIVNNVVDNTMKNDEKKKNRQLWLQLFF